MCAEVLGDGWIGSGGSDDVRKEDCSNEKDAGKLWCFIRDRQRHLTLSLYPTHQPQTTPNQPHQ